MNLENLSYDAFISYRHSELDKFVAEKLHKQLETFKLPKNVTRRLLAGSRKKIKRIFRDRDELPLASNLADPITNALKASDFLIVICSPRLPESLWCKKEIDTFIQFHGREHVLAVLAEGEPEQSFPESLLFTYREITMPDGRTRREKVSIEPLAADVRGRNKKEVSKNLKKEILRLAAPMFDLSYDDLKQRHRERRIKRILTAALAGSAVCLSFGAVSTAMAYRIHKQSVKIEAQSSEIAAQSERITSQYSQAMVTRSKSLADTALKLLGEGDRIQSMLVAKAALPGNPLQPDMPYTAEAAYALTEASYLYKNDSQILPFRVLEHDAQVDFSLLSPKGDRILSGDAYGTIYVWDALTGKKLFETAPAASQISSLGQAMVSFLDNDHLLYPAETGFSIYNLALEKIESQVTDLPYSKAVPGNKGVLAAIADYSTISVQDTKSGRRLCAYSLPKDVAIESIAFNEDDTMVAFSGTTDTLNEHAKSTIYIMDSSNGKITHSYDAPRPSVGKMLFYGNILYAITNSSMFSGTLTAPADGGICALDLKKSGSIKWFHEATGYYLQDFELLDGKGKKLLMYSSYDRAGVLRRQDGTFVGEQLYNSEIVNFVPLKGADNALLFTRNGGYHFLSAADMADYVFTNVFKSNSDNVKSFSYGDGFYASLPHGSNKITLYQYAKGSGLKEGYPAAVTDAGVDVNDGETMLLTAGLKQAFAYDIKTKKELAVITPDSDILGISFAGDGSLAFAIVTQDALLVYDAKSFELKNKLDYSDRSARALQGFDSNKSFAAMKSYDGIFLCDLLAKTDPMQIPFPSDAGTNSSYAVNNKKDLLAVASEAKKELLLYPAGSADPLLHVPLRSALVSCMNFNSSDELLYITYQDSRIEVYRTEDLALTRTYDAFDSQMKGIVEPAGTDYTILTGISESYLLDKNGDITAHMSGFKEVLPNSNEFLLLCRQNLESVPVYDMNSLLKESETALQGAALTSAQKKMLHMEEASHY